VNSRRLSSGGRIDRTKPVSFRFNGRRYGGFAGDTLASALLANDVAVVSRSFKLHRPSHAAAFSWSVRGRRVGPLATVPVSVSTAT
jgi:NADPH-dependent 2,4-dienoyl-CoA reductase/sulfur reductase-like enzyme